MSAVKNGTLYYQVYQNTNEGSDNYQKWYARAKHTETVTFSQLITHTTEPGLQLYTGNFENGISGTHGSTYPKRSAVCLEAQHFPDSPNHLYFPSVVLRPGQQYKQTTIYKFGVKK